MATTTSVDGKYTVTYTLNPAILHVSSNGQSATIAPATISNVTVAPTVINPPISTAGLITNFNPAPGNRFSVDGVSYGVQNDAKSYSVTKVDNYTLRFQIESGENWGSAVGGPDDPGVDRSELNSTVTYPAGTLFTLNYQFMVESNGANGAFNNSAQGWFIVGQFHNDDSSLGVGTSPPIAMNMLGSHLQVITRYVLPGGVPGNDPGNTTVEQVLWTDPNPIVTGVYHTIQIQAKVINGIGGYVHVTIDGNVVVNYTGPLGYGTGVEWEYGIYRNTSPEICAVNYRNVTISP